MTDRGREIVFTRIFDAPRELVWKAWTDPKHLAQWWGPKGFTNTIQEIDAKPGGIWRFVMHGPDGTDYQNQIVFVEVVKPERLVYRHGSGVADDPGEFQTIVTFAEQGGKTELTMRLLFKSAEERDRVVRGYNAIEGGNQTLDRLREQLTKMAVEGSNRELVITRIFDAPRKLVWKAWTEPELFTKRWGPKGFTAPFCTIDFRVGGKFLGCMRSPDGKDYWSTGIYREIVPLERIVCTDSFADEKGNAVPATQYGMGADFPLEMLVIVTFEEYGGKTTMTLKHIGLPAGEMTEQTGIGWNESFDKLAEYLAKIL